MRKTSHSVLSQVTVKFIVKIWCTCTKIYLHNIKIVFVDDHSPPIIYHSKCKIYLGEEEETYRKCLPANSF